MVVHVFSTQNIITNACKEKTEWLENTSDATTQDFISQRQNLDEIITPIIQKLNEPGRYVISSSELQIKLFQIIFKLQCLSAHKMNIKRFFSECLSTMNYFDMILTVETVSIQYYDVCMCVLPFPGNARSPFCCLYPINSSKCLL